MSVEGPDLHAFYIMSIDRAQRFAATIDDIVIVSRARSAEFDETKHPRDEHGRWTDGTTSSLPERAHVEFTESNLNDAEQYAAELYSKSSGGVNASLRGQAKPFAVDTRGGMKDSQIKDLDSAIAKGTITNDTTLYRGVSWPFFSQLTEGTEFVDHGFLSTTQNRTVAENFGAGRLVAQVRVPAGTHALYIPTYYEDEFVLPRDMTFRVVNKHSDALVLEVVK